MCKLSKKYLTEKEFTGYKFAVKKDGKYYSPAMEIEYKEGMFLPKIDRNHIRHLKPRTINSCLLPPRAIIFGKTFVKEMVGRTSVFKSRKGAEGLLIEVSRYSKNYEPIILKMTIAKALIKGTYFGKDIVAGRQILKIEEI